MEHRDHVRLLNAGIRQGRSGARWADIGAGSGAFTLALADLLGPGSAVTAVDRDGAALATCVDAVRSRFPGVAIDPLVADFRRPLPPALNDLDGIVMANALHFVERRDQASVVSRLVERLRAGGTFIVVEYDADRGNPWVPHPFSFAAWTTIAAEAGLEATTLADREPSRFLGAIYSAVSRRPMASASRS